MVKTKPKIFNYVSGVESPLTWGKYIEEMHVHYHRAPPLRSIWYVFSIYHTNLLVGRFLRFWLHRIPAVFVDLLLIINGKKPKWVRRPYKILLNWNLQIITFVVLPFDNLKRRFSNGDFPFVRTRFFRMLSWRCGESVLSASICLCLGPIQHARCATVFTKSQRDPAVFFYARREVFLQSRFEWWLNYRVCNERSQTCTMIFFTLSVIFKSFFPSVEKRWSKPSSCKIVRPRVYTQTVSDKLGQWGFVVIAASNGFENIFFAYGEWDIRKPCWDSSR